VRIIPRFLLASFFFPACFCVAQTPSQPQHAPDGGTRETFSSISIPSLPNAPFTATVNTEWTRHLPDGSDITLKNHRSIARDAKGRIFQERRYFVPDDGKHESTVTRIEISDPATHERYVCRVAEHTCRLEPFVEMDSVVQAKPGAPSVESLGTQTISGLQTVGSRETHVIGAGAIGNESPILQRREFWYSPLLGINLITKRQDPRFSSQQNFEVTNIALGEPDAKLFEPPSGYKILDLRKPPEVPSTQATSVN
jgi:hypothetical protein